MISADGRSVAFVSIASNLVPNDTNNARDIFLRDRVTGMTTRVSVASDGTQSNESPFTLCPNCIEALEGEPSISEDGRFVTFTSRATNLVPGDTAGFKDVFLRDSLTHTTTRVSFSSHGEEVAGDSSTPHISADGRYVAYFTQARNMFQPNVGNSQPQAGTVIWDRLSGQTVATGIHGLEPQLSRDGRYLAVRAIHPSVPDDINSDHDIYLLDRASAAITVVSQRGVMNGAVGSPSVSADGRFVSYSTGEPMVAEDTNKHWDLYQWDRLTGKQTRISVAWNAAQANGDTFNSFLVGNTMSEDGRYLVATSTASNVVEGDTNEASDVFVWERDGLAAIALARVTLKIPRKVAHHERRIRVRVRLVPQPVVPISGTIKIKVGKRSPSPVAGSGRIKADGTARIRLKHFEPGRYRLQAKYLGSPFIAPAKSSKVRLRVI